MPAIQYRTADRKRVPSVTSIIKHIDPDAEGLIRWAHRLGQDGIDLEEARQAAASVGTITHACIAADLKDEKVDLSNVPPELLEGVTEAFGNWRLWRGSVELEPVASDVSLVSERYRFGGTSDAVCMVQGQRTLLDFKTGARLYPKDVGQIGGYSILYDEHHPEEPIERSSLLRLGKESGGFTWVHFTAEQMVPVLDAFLIARHQYDSLRVLKKMVG